MTSLSRSNPSKYQQPKSELTTDFRALDLTHNIGTRACTSVILSESQIQNVKLCYVDARLMFKEVLTIRRGRRPDLSIKRVPTTVIGTCITSCNVLEVITICVEH